MPVASAKKLLDIAQSEDPKIGIQTAIGDLERIQVLGDWVLAGTYIQPERRKSGLYLTGDTLKEDEYQGVVGLILQMGPDAEAIASEVKGPQVGDWIVYSIRDSWSQTVNGAPCRLLHYERIRMRISDPKVIYDS